MCWRQSATHNTTNQSAKNNPAPPVRVIGPAVPRLRAADGLQFRFKTGNTGLIEESDEFPFEDVDPERLTDCRYWRCGELFERRSANHIFCRKACRSRQRKWERSVERKRLKSQARHQRSH